LEIIFCFFSGNHVIILGRKYIGGCARPLARIRGSMATPLFRDASERILHMVDVAASMSVVRYLLRHMEKGMQLSPLDACLYSVAVIGFTQAMMNRVHFQLAALSRRISFLILVEKVRPFVVAWMRDEGRGGPASWEATGQAVISNGLILIMTALVPREIASTREGAIILTAIQYMYADVLSCVVRRWPDARMAALALGIEALHWLARQRFRSHLWAVLCDVGSAACVNLVVGLVVDMTAVEDGGGGGGARLLSLLLVTTMVYSVARFIGVAEAARDYFVFLVASEVPRAFLAAPGGSGDDNSGEEGWVVLGCLATAATLFRTVWPGPRSWMSDCVLVAGVNVAVERVLGYIQRLAVNDTIITLKTSALVLQFMLHEFGVVLAVWDGRYGVGGVCAGGRVEKLE